jgi:uncharacterized protein YjdB
VTYTISNINNTRVANKVIDATRKKEEIQSNTPLVDFFSNKNETENPELKANNTESLIIWFLFVSNICPSFSGVNWFN